MIVRNNRLRTWIQISAKDQLPLNSYLSGSIASEFYLEIEGSLDGDINEQVSDLIILGESQKGEKYPLLQCFSIN